MGKIVRGRPDPGDAVHYQHPTMVKIEPLCRDGNFHVFVTNEKRSVTCVPCLDAMKKLGLIIHELNESPNNHLDDISGSP